RQVVLYDTAKTFDFVMMESALSSPLLTPGQMLAQVDRIEEAAKLPNVTVKVIPNGADLLFPPLSGFNLLDDSTLILELGGTPFILRDRQEVEFHRRVFEHYASLAVKDLGALLESYKARYAEEAYPKDASGLAAGPTAK